MDYVSVIATRKLTSIVIGLKGTAVYFPSPLPPLLFSPPFPINPVPLLYSLHNFVSYLDESNKDQHFVKQNYFICLTRTGAFYQVYNTRRRPNCQFFGRPRMKLLYICAFAETKKTGANTIPVFYQFSETHSEMFLSYSIPLSFVLYGKNEFKTWSPLKLQ